MWSLDQYPSQRRMFTLLEVLIGMFLAIILLSTLSYFYQQVELMNSEAEQVQKESFQLRYVENRLAKILPQTLSEREAKKHFHFYTSHADGLLKSPSLLFVYYNGVNLESPFANDVLGRLYLDEQNKQLCIATWPSPRRWKLNETPPMAKEVLLNNVESLSFEFYVAPDRDRSKVIDRKLTPAERKREEQEEKLKAQKDQQSKTSKKPDVKPPNPDQKSESEKQVENPSAEEGLVQQEVRQPKGPWSPEWSHEYEHLPAMVKIHLKQQVKDRIEEITFAFPLPCSQKVIVYEEKS